jgi:hypothetical protein
MTPFFVGWSGLPRGLRRFVLVVLAVLIVSEAGLATGLYMAQPARGTGAWDPSGEWEITGVLVTRPYPMLRVPAAAARPAALVLLVDEWKFGASLGPDLGEGDLVRATGYAIRRGDMTVLQLDRGLVRVARAAPAPALRLAGERSFVGEIVDAKCWTGAMQPGDGKAHAGCGSLCLLGGVPALFITTADDGIARWYIIADEGGGSLGEGLRARIGERLTLHGTVYDAPDLREFRVSAAALLP